MAVNTCLSKKNVAALCKENVHHISSLRSNKGYIKTPSPLSWVLGVDNMKTTCRKSWPANLWQVTNLTFDQCFNVKWGSS